MCSQCKQVQVAFPNVRCMPCNITYNRVLACKKGMDGARIAAWDNMGKAKKEAFMRSAQGLTVHQLKDFIKQFILDQCHRWLLYVFCETALAAPALRQIAEYLS